MKQLLKLSIITFFIFSLSQNKTFAQGEYKPVTISYEEFEKEYSVFACDSYYPKEKLPKDVLKAYVFFYEEGSIAHLIYQYNDYYKVFPHIEIDFSYNFAKAVGSEYQNGEVLISSQIPFSATIITGHFKIVDDRLIFLKEERYDPNESATSEADQALIDGDIKKATDLYNEVMYPPIDYYESLQPKLLIRAYDVAYKQFKNKEYKKACETMGYAYEFAYIEKESNILNDKKIINILANYSYFLDKAELYEKCIEVSNIVVFADVNAVGPYMHLGDSYYHTNKKKEALKAYKIYSKLRLEQGKKVPSYVTERINEISGNN